MKLLNYLLLLCSLCFSTYVLAEEPAEPAPEEVVEEPVTEEPVETTEASE